MKFLYQNLFVVLFIVFHSNLFGQRILWGKDQEEIIPGMLRALKTDTSNGIYAIKGLSGGPYADYYTLKKERFIEKYDYSFNLEFQYELPLPDYESKKVKLEEFTSFAGKELVFASYIQEDEQVFLYAQVTKNGETKPYKELGKVFLEGRGATGLNIIKKNEKLFVQVQNAKGRKNYSSFYFFVLNKNLQLEASNKIKLSVPTEKYSVQKSVVDQLGNCHLLIKYKKEKDASTGARNDYGYQLHSLIKGAMIQTNIDLDAGILKQVNLFSTGDDLIISGFYSTKQNEVKATALNQDIEINMQTGVFFGRVNATEPFKLTIVKNDFGPDFNDVEEKKSTNAISNDFLFQDLIMKEDGGCFIFSEEISNSNSSYPGYVYPGGIGMVQATGVTVYYKNILVIELDREGKIKRHFLVKKKQDGKDSLIPYCSYAKSVRKGNIFLIFSDNEKYSQESKNILHFKNANHGVTVVCTIDENGNQSRVVLDGSDEVGLIKIAYIIKKSETEFIVYKNNTLSEKFRFGVIKFE